MLRESSFCALAAGVLSCVAVGQDAVPRSAIEQVWLSTQFLGDSMTAASGDPTDPLIDRSGRVTFRARVLAGCAPFCAENFEAIYQGTGSDLSFHRVEGLAVPGMTDALENVFPIRVIDDGTVVARVILDGESSLVVWSPPSNVELVARVGDPVPTFGGSAVSSLRSEYLTPTGDVLFSASNDASYRYRDGVYERLVGPGATVPGLGLPLLFGVTRSTDLSGNDVVVAGNLELINGVTMRDDSVAYTVGGSSSGVLFREGDIAPTFEDEGFLLSGFSLDSNGVAGHYRGSATLQEVTDFGSVSRGKAWYLIEPNGIARIAREGDPSPTRSGGTISDILFDPMTRDPDWVLCTVIAEDPDESGLFVWHDGAFLPIFQRGDVLPFAAGLDANAAAVAVNSSGDIVFRVSFTRGIGGVGTSNDSALYVFDAELGQFRLIVREGELFEYDERGVSVSEAITFLSFDSGMGVWGAGTSGLSDSRQVAFQLGFGGSRSPRGVFVASLEGDGCSIADLAPPFGVTDLDDVDAFIAAFLATDPVADLAEPLGVFDLDDTDAFITAFLAGCP